MSELLASNIMAALATVGFFVVVYLTFYFAGYGWSLGAERARQKAHRELSDRVAESFKNG